MRYEYCQVNIDWGSNEAGDEDYKTFDKIVAYKPGRILATGRYWIEVFNILGSEGWEMCGQQTTEVKTRPKADAYGKDVFGYEPMYFFKRTIAEVSAVNYGDWLNSQ